MQCLSFFSLFSHNLGQIWVFNKSLCSVFAQRTSICTALDECHLQLDIFAGFGLFLKFYAYVLFSCSYQSQRVFEHNVETQFVNIYNMQLWYLTFIYGDNERYWFNWILLLSWSKCLFLLFWLSILCFIISVCVLSCITHAWISGGGDSEC